MSEALQKKWKSVLSDGNQSQKHSRYRVGPLGLNLLLSGQEDVPAGRMLHVYGKPGSGKSTLALSTIAHAQKTDLKRTPLLIDFERAFIPEYAQSLGVDLSRIFVVRPESSEEGIQVAMEFIKANATNVIVIDSVAAAVPADEMDKDFTDRPKMASSSTVVTRMCLKLNPLVFDHDVLMICLNQTRKNFSPMSPEDEVAFGANAMHFYAAAEIHTKKKGTKEDRIEVIATIKKNRIAGKYGKTEYFVTAGKGIEYGMHLVDIGIQLELVKKAGAWYTYKEFRGQGAENASLVFPLHELEKDILELVEKERVEL